MRIIRKLIAFGLLVGALIWFGGVLADRTSLGEDLIRLHVVANSDSDRDQAVKLQVRDAVIGQLQPVMEELSDAETAKAYLTEHLEELEELANRVLEELGGADRAKVTLQKEAFDTRKYDTFTLPAGVYESLRITIGQGRGRNWWCVVFPTLCAGATGDGFEDTAAGAGFSDSLTGALEKGSGYSVRFFFLDCLGKIEKFFFLG